MPLLKGKQFSGSLNISNISGSSTSTASFGIGHFADKIGIGTTHPSQTLYVSGTDGIVIPYGTTGERSSSPKKGEIRYSTTLSTFEGYDGSNWGSLSGVIDVDQDTKIDAESSAGADNDEIRMFTAGTQQWTVGPAGHLTGSSGNHISASLTSTGSFGRVASDTITAVDIVATNTVTAQEFHTEVVSSSIIYESGSTKFGDSIDDLHDITGSLNVTSSVEVSGTLTATMPLTSSTAIYTNNLQNGYPSSNEWGSGLGGSYFNNFDNTTHVSEILRFMSGVLSHSLDVADAAPNAKTFASVDTNETSLGSTSTISGYLPQSYDSSNATMLYLVTKSWVSAGATIFSGITQYYQNGSTYYIDFDSNSGGTTTVSSSADSELFDLGGLTNAAATEFKVRIHTTQSFSDTGSVSAPTTASATFFTQSMLDLSTTSFGTSNGLTLAKITTATPSVIPAAYQDGKFADVGGTSMSGSLSRRYSGSSASDDHTLFNDFTSVSSSGYYRFHDLKVGLATGSGDYQVVNGTTKTHFWAPLTTIDTAIGNNSLSIAQVTQSYQTSVSRSLSGAPYLSGSTYHISASISGLFDPMYEASSTIVDDSIGSVGAGSVAGSGVDGVSTSGGTIQTANAVYASDSGSVRSTGVVPTRTDVVRFNATYTLTGTGENINQTGLSDETFTVGVRGRNRKDSRSTLQTITFYYHSGSTFSQPALSGSMAFYGRAQGYDGGSLTGTSEAFTGESFRIKLNDSIPAFSGSAFATASFNVTRSIADRLIGEQDLQVKPGFLVNPSGSYRYWYAAGYGTGSYKYYVRRFQTSGTKTSMTVDVGKTLVNWDATTDDSVACALLFKSSASGSGATTKLARARVYDPSELTANAISSSMSTDFYKNPFSAAIDLYGNTGGSKSSNEYTVPMRNGDGMYLDDNDNEIYLILRYTGDPTPVTSITLTFS